MNCTIDIVNEHCKRCNWMTVMIYVCYAQTNCNTSSSYLCIMSLFHNVINCHSIRALFFPNNYNSFYLSVVWFINLTLNRLWMIDRKDTIKLTVMICICYIQTNCNHISISYPLHHIYTMISSQKIVTYDSLKFI